MKGRNTTVISVRLPDNIVAILTERAKDISVGEYLRQQIIKGCSHDSPSVNTIPVYDPAIHKEGDRVMVRRGKRLVETIVPMIEAE